MVRLCIIHYASKRKNAIFGWKRQDKTFNNVKDAE
jgi:hypothetical protein